MTKRLVVVFFGIAVLLGACLGAVTQDDPEQSEGLSAVVYKEPG